MRDGEIIVSPHDSLVDHDGNQRSSPMRSAAIIPFPSGPSDSTKNGPSDHCHSTISIVSDQCKQVMPDFSPSSDAIACVKLNDNSRTSNNINVLTGKVSAIQVVSGGGAGERVEQVSLLNCDDLQH